MQHTSVLWWLRAAVATSLVSFVLVSLFATSSAFVTFGPYGLVHSLANSDNVRYPSSPGRSARSLSDSPSTGRYFLAPPMSELYYTLSPPPPVPGYLLREQRDYNGESGQQRRRLRLQPSPDATPFADDNNYRLLARRNIAPPSMGVAPRSFRQQPSYYVPPSLSPITFSGDGVDRYGRSFLNNNNNNNNVPLNDVFRQTQMVRNAITNINPSLQGRFPLAFSPNNNGIQQQPSNNFQTGSYAMPSYTSGLNSFNGLSSRSSAPLPQTQQAPRLLLPFMLQTPANNNHNNNALDFNRRTNDRVADISSAVNRYVGNTDLSQIRQNPPLQQAPLPNFRSFQGGQGPVYPQTSLNQPISVEPQLSGQELSSGGQPALQQRGGNVGGNENDFGGPPLIEEGFTGNQDNAYLPRYALEKQAQFEQFGIDEPGNMNGGGPKGACGGEGGDFGDLNIDRIISEPRREYGEASKTNRRQQPQPQSEGPRPSETVVVEERPTEKEPEPTIVKINIEKSRPTLQYQQQDDGKRIKSDESYINNNNKQDVYYQARPSHTEIEIRPAATAYEVGLSPTGPAGAAGLYPPFHEPPAGATTTTTTPAPGRTLNQADAVSANNANLIRTDNDTFSQATEASNNTSTIAITGSQVTSQFAMVDDGVPSQKITSTETSISPTTTETAPMPSSPTKTFVLIPPITPDGSSPSTTIKPFIRVAIDPPIVSTVNIADLLSRKPLRTTPFDETSNVQQRQETETAPAFSPQTVPRNDFVKQRKVVPLNGQAVTAKFNMEQTSIGAPIPGQEHQQLQSQQNALAVPNRRTSTAEVSGAPNTASPLDSFERHLLSLDGELNAFVHKLEQNVQKAGSNMNVVPSVPAPALLSVATPLENAAVTDAIQAAINNTKNSRVFGQPLTLPTAVPAVAASFRDELMLTTTSIPLSPQKQILQAQKPPDDETTRKIVEIKSEIKMDLTGAKESLPGPRPSPVSSTTFSPFPVESIFATTPGNSRDILAPKLLLDPSALNQWSDIVRPALNETSTEHQVEQPKLAEDAEEDDDETNADKMSSALKSIRDRQPDYFFATNAEAKIEDLPTTEATTTTEPTTTTEVSTTKLSQTTELSTTTEQTTSTEPPTTTESTTTTEVRPIFFEDSETAATTAAKVHVANTVVRFEADDGDFVALPHNDANNRSNEKLESTTKVAEETTTTPSSTTITQQIVDEVRINVTTITSSKKPQLSGRSAIDLAAAANYPGSAEQYSYRTPTDEEIAEKLKVMERKRAKEAEMKKAGTKIAVVEEKKASPALGKSKFGSSPPSLFGSRQFFKGAAVTDRMRHMVAASVVRK